MAVEGREIEFQLDGSTARGYLVLTAGRVRKPGLILIHEWWGLNDHVKDLTSRFAEEGYAVLAPDLYDGPAQRTRKRQGS